LSCVNHSGVVKIKSLPPHPNPLPQGGEGGREPIGRLFKS
jgi:hypothetical protein